MARGPRAGSLLIVVSSGFSMDQVTVNRDGAVRQSRINPNVAECCRLIEIRIPFSPDGAIRPHLATRRTSGPPRGWPDMQVRRPKDWGALPTLVDRAAEIRESRARPLALGSVDNALP